MMRTFFGKCPALLQRYSTNATIPKKPASRTSCNMSDALMRMMAAERSCGVALALTLLAAPLAARLSTAALSSRNVVKTLPGCIGVWYGRYAKSLPRMKYSDAAYSGGPTKIRTYCAMNIPTFEGLKAEIARVMNPASQTAEAQNIIKPKCIHL